MATYGFLVNPNPCVFQAESNLNKQGKAGTTVKRQRPFRRTQTPPGTRGAANKAVLLQDHADKAHAQPSPRLLLQRGAINRSCKPNPKGALTPVSSTGIYLSCYQAWEERIVQKDRK